MGVLGAIGKGLGIAGGVLAAPFTGGGSLAAIAPLLGAGGAILSGVAAGRGQGKQVEGQQRLAMDDNSARLYDIVTRNLMQQGQMGANRAQFERDSPDVRFRQGLRGDFLANMPQQTGRISSLLNPSPQARQMGRDMSALGRGQLGKDTFSIPNLPAPPQMQGMPQAGWLDKLLGIAGPAMEFAGAIPGMMPRGGGQAQGGVNPDLLGNVDFGAGSQQAHPRLPLGSIGQGIDPDVLFQGMKGNIGQGFVDPRMYGGTQSPWAMY